jgi:XTP/dITP diphosphohydrolase
VKILLATTNRKKAAEMTAILHEEAGPAVELVTLADFSGLHPVTEDGATFLENARKKAAAGLAATGLPTIGEDSGLAVDALDGAPGIYSARYAGGEGGDEANWRKLLHEMEGVRPGRRQAHFVCSAVLALPDRHVAVEGRVDGEITRVPHGEGGFGYDPVFLLPDGRTMAELKPGEKDAISHRGAALRQLAKKLRELAGS